MVRTKMNYSKPITLFVSGLAVGMTLVMVELYSAGTSLANIDNTVLLKHVLSYSNNVYALSWKTIEDVDTGVLLSLLERKLQKMRDTGTLRTLATENLTNCNSTKWPNAPCVDRNCHPTHQLSPRLSRETIEKIRKPVREVGVARLTDMLKMFDVIKSERKRVVIVTAASKDHFHESEAAIEHLQKNVFPTLTNYSLIYYDIGLSLEQREIITKYSGAELRNVPYIDLPCRFKYNRCYIWKPLVTFSHMQNADYLIWMDASVRFLSSIEPYLQIVDNTGMLLHRDRFHFPQNTAKTMFDYYGDKACQFSQYGELESGIMIFKNEPFIRHLVFEPWVACALDAKCMCPDSTKRLLRCPSGSRRYGKCHRYDQSAIAYSLILALREDVSSVLFHKYLHTIKRNHKGFSLTIQHRADNNLTDSTLTKPKSPLGPTTTTTTTTTVLETTQKEDKSIQKKNTIGVQGVKPLRNDKKKGPLVQKKMKKVKQKSN